MGLSLKCQLSDSSALSRFLLISVPVSRYTQKPVADRCLYTPPDLLTVSETANEPPQDEGNSFNSPRNLAMEATYINHNFSQQCLRMVLLPLHTPTHPFPSLTLLTLTHCSP